jgi:hypothetical protein
MMTVRGTHPTCFLPPSPVFLKFVPHFEIHPSPSGGEGMRMPVNKAFQSVKIISDNSASGGEGSER